jgi:uncharacterized protein YjiS (DUF1127 family)
MSGSLFEVWRRRRRYRWHLTRLLRDEPELILDIGLSIRAAELEIAKPFWRA